MVDPYQPPLDSFEFEDDETAVINLALASESPWDYTPETKAELTALKSAKNKILNLHLQRHGSTCCYCRTNLTGAGPFMTDREHVLPKGNPKYKMLSYELWNLAAACKRCNMEFKRNNDEFVIDSDDPETLKKSSNYRFAHPNFDLWDDHLTRITLQFNTKNLVKFLCANTTKADYTYKFFNLQGLEVDSFDAGQGLNNATEESAAVVELRKIALEFRQ